ncbi:3-ketosteroid-9-alpha-hydroxylase reductase subunit [Nocardia nova SH22a]|uniref:3-ketosteroid-9-alpha-hydroxylase reductase subunit n=1 Tax=Nocardia nova SH22a TaxID=1415166 RepID=W5TLE3_9NOCA|nr:ferredoxin--NADP reductase [Nocardia nova]AHH19949.1 3-ketosteroid-9-alpha-hydroxylase reductase subunit [Nocardia nova SH22a]
MTSRAHEVTVVDVIAETAQATSLVLDIGADLVDAFAYRPGQFITVRVPSSRDGSVARCYSLSSSPHRSEPLTITVKRTRGGYASNWLCDNVSVGTALTVLEPSGVFVPESLDDDLLLCAAGSGITPMAAIVKSVLYAGSGTVTLLYANRDEESVIFGERLAELAAEFPRRLQVLHWLESERGLPDTAGLTALLDDRFDREIFLCGPEGFATVLRSAVAAAGGSRRRIHREEYRSLTENPFAASPSPCVPGTGGTTVEVELDGATYVFDWPRGTRLLDVLLSAGLDPPYVCRESACGTCVCWVAEGATEMVAREALLDEEVAAGFTLACQTVPLSDRVRVTFDRDLP